MLAEMMNNFIRILPPWATLAVTTLSDLDFILKMILTIVAIGYTIYQWRVAWVNNNKKDK